jgi:hypothetical protein
MKKILNVESFKIRKVKLLPCKRTQFSLLDDIRFLTNYCVTLWIILQFILEIVKTVLKTFIANSISLLCIHRKILRNQVSFCFFVFLEYWLRYFYFYPIGTNLIHRRCYFHPLHLDSKIVKFHSRCSLLILILPLQ